MIERIVFILAKDTTIHATFIDSLSQLILPVLFVLTGVEQKMQEEKRKRKAELLEEDLKKSVMEPSSGLAPNEPKSREFNRLLIFAIIRPLLTSYLLQSENPVKNQTIS